MTTQTITRFTSLLAVSALTALASPARAQGRERTISAEEYQLALSIFQREFPARDRMTITDSAGLGNRPYVRPTAGVTYIHINLGPVYDHTLD